MTHNHLDPEIREFLKVLNGDWQKHPPVASLSMPEARMVAEQVRARWTDGGAVMEAIQEHRIATDAGSIRIRVYHPAGTVSGPRPALIYMHGGGFVFFSLDTHDRLMREYAAAGDFVVVGVDYPLSPEAKYPTALDRVVAFIRWLTRHGDAIGIDPHHIVLGGDSAGANLAVSTCLKLREIGENALVGGILCNYGAFSGRCSDEAEKLHGGPDSIMDRAEIEAYFTHYLNGPDELDDPLACPLLADLHGLPPVFLVIPEFDILTEQSLLMRERLAEAGVEVDSRIYAGATHSFLEAMSIAAVARTAIEDGATWVRARLSS